MLSAVLRSDTAIQTSIAIMDAFVQMRRFLSGNAGLLQRMDVMELRQLEYQKRTDERFEQVFGCLEAHAVQESMQVFHVGASIKDAGKKCFAVSKLEDETLVRALLEAIGC